MTDVMLLLKDSAASPSQHTHSHLLAHMSPCARTCFSSCVLQMLVIYGVMREDPEGGLHARMDNSSHKSGNGMSWMHYPG